MSEMKDLNKLQHLIENVAISIGSFIALVSHGDTRSIQDDSKECCGKLIYLK